MNSRAVCLVSLCLAYYFSLSAALAADFHPSLPDAGLIAHIETKIKLPEGALVPISDFDRYYAEEILNGQVFIIGEFNLFGKTKSIHIVGSRDEFPGIMDGGCGVINLTYDLRLDEVTQIECNGEA